MDLEKEANEIRDAAEHNSELYATSLPMIASENIISPLCKEMLISDFHGRYAEGTPGQRYYQGCQYFDIVEEKTIHLAKKLFNCSYADVRLPSGTTANMAVFKALAEPGDKVTVLDTADGAHISYGKWGAAGIRGLELISYPFNGEEMNIDIDGAIKTIRDHQPTLALFGRSVFLFPTPLRELSEVAHEEGALVLYDAAHVLGLIGGKKFQDPLGDGADVVTGSTHKTLPGPQGGIILSNLEDDKITKRLGWGVFPGVASSYHLHHVAAKGIAFAEHLAFGKDYAGQIIVNAQALGQALWDEGFDVLCEHLGFTQSHQIVFRVGEDKGKWAAETLEQAGIIANMNMVPGDQHPLHPSGIRLGVQELTRIGMKEDEMGDVANFIGRVLLKKEGVHSIQKEILQFRREYQEVHYCFHPGHKGYAYHRLV
jgi:glycine hydroxymethyltransferase